MILSSQNQRQEQTHRNHKCTKVERNNIQKFKDGELNTMTYFDNNKMVSLS